MLIWFHDFHAAVPASVPMEYMQTLPQIVQISLLWKCIIHRPIYGLSLTVHELVSTSHWNLPAYQVMWNFINTEAWRPSVACAESPVWMAAEPSRVLAQGPQEVVSNNHVLFFFFLTSVFQRTEPAGTILKILLLKSWALWKSHQVNISLWRLWPLWGPSPSGLTPNIIPSSSTGVVSAFQES